MQTHHGQRQALHRALPPAGRRLQRRHRGRRCRSHCGRCSPCGPARLDVALARARHANAGCCAAAVGMSGSTCVYEAEAETEAVSKRPFFVPDSEVGAVRASEHVRVFARVGFQTCPSLRAQQHTPPCRFALLGSTSRSSAPCEANRGRSVSRGRMGRRQRLRWRRLPCLWWTDANAGRECLSWRIVASARP